MFTELISIHGKCPECGAETHSSIFAILARSAVCEHCGMKLSDAFSIKEHNDETVILVPPDKIPGLFLFLLGVCCIGLPLYLILVGTDAFSHKLLGALIFSAFFFLFLTMWLIGDSGTKNFINSFLAGKKIILKGNQIIVSILRGNAKEYVFDCSPENSPRATHHNRNNISEILVRSGKLSVAFGAGMTNIAIDEILEVMQVFLRNIEEKHPKIPEPVASAMGALDSFGHAMLEEDVKVDASEENNLSDTTEEPVNPKSIEIFQDEQSITLITTALWGPLKWLRFLVATTAFIGVAFLIYYFKLDFGISVSLPIGGGLAFAFAYFMDIKLRIYSEKIIIIYKIFNIVQWQRTISIADIIAVGDNWDGACAIHTVNRSYRVSHFTNTKSRNYLSVLICEVLKERSNWRSEKWFKVEISDDEIEKIRIIPSGVRVFDELGAPLIPLLFFSILFVPLSCLIELIMYTILKDLLDFPEISAEQAMPFLIMSHALVFIWILIRLMKAPVVISVKECSVDGNAATVKILLVTRCVWKESLSSSSFKIQEPLNINVEQLDTDSVITSQKGFCVITQNDTTVRFGALLDWDELLELKKEIQAMIDSAKASSV